MKSILTFILLAYTQVAWSQTINVHTDSIKWQTTHVVQSADSSHSMIDCSFETYANAKVVMHIGSNDHTFDIMGVEGTWTDIAHNGSVTFFFDEDQLLKMKIERTSELLSIIVDFTGAGGTYTLYNVNSLNKIN